MPNKTLPDLGSMNWAQEFSQVLPLKSPKSASFIEKMRFASALAAEVLEKLACWVQAGVTTQWLDEFAHAWICKVQKATPACLGYRGYPASTCISINEIVCHGIPNHTKLHLGDIVNIDVTVLAHGVFGDTSKMYKVGEIGPSALHLCKITQQSLYAAIQQVRPGLRLQEIGRCIESIATQNRLSVVRDYCGHFIGTRFHESPNVLHYFADDQGFTLREGMTFTIEPMLNLGSSNVRLMRDGWTVQTRDRSLSAQYEHTILVTARGYEILTYREEEQKDCPRQST